MLERIGYITFGGITNTGTVYQKPNGIVCVDDERDSFNNLQDLIESLDGGFTFVKG